MSGKNKKWAEVAEGICVWVGSFLGLLKVGVSFTICREFYSF